MQFFSLFFTTTIFYPDMVSKCDLCDKTLKKRELGRHVRSVHEKQRHQCLFCMKLFTRKYTLTKHEKLHGKVINSNIG